MRGSKQDLPVAFEEEGVRSQQVEWGDMNVALERFPPGLIPPLCSKACPMIAASAPIGATSSRVAFESGTPTMKRFSARAMSTTWHLGISPSLKRTAKLSSSAPKESIRRPWKSRSATWLPCANPRNPHGDPCKYPVPTRRGRNRHFKQRR